MKILIDTSVLVAALVDSHPAYARSRPHLAAASQRKFECLVAAQTLAEAFATLTRLAVSPRIAPAQADSLLQEDVRPHVTVVALSADDYWAVLNSQARLGLAGGTVYDALLLRAARKARADRILTLNRLHFRRVAPDIADKIVEP